MSEQRETGWHMHGRYEEPRQAHRDTYEVCDDGDRRPVLVVPVGGCLCGCPPEVHVDEIGCACALPGEAPCFTAHEAIARALREVDDRVLVDTNFERISASYDEQADAVLAALAAPAPSGALHEEVEGRG